MCLHKLSLSAIQISVNLDSVSTGLSGQTGSCRCTHASPKHRVPYRQHSSMGKHVMYTRLPYHRAHIIGWMRKSFSFFIVQKHLKPVHFHLLSPVSNCRNVIYLCSFFHLPFEEYRFKELKCFLVLIAKCLSVCLSVCLLFDVSVCYSDHLSVHPPPAFQQSSMFKGECWTLKMVKVP